MQNEFIEFFYKNSFENPNFDFLGDFWGQFWSIFANKMINNNKIETLFNKEQKNILKPTYTQNNIFQNFLSNKSPKEENNNEIPKSINILSNISKNTNNNNIGETEEFINMIPNKHERNEINIRNKMEKSNNHIGKNNQNFYEEEEEEEGENDIEKEMDEANDIHFNKENSPNIIKQESGNDLNKLMLANEYENDIWIGMENVEKDTGVLNSFQIVNGKSIKSQTVRIPKGFMIFGKLRPYLNKYWENSEEYDDIVCSSEFLCFLPKKELNKSFFKFILSSYIIQEQIADSMTGARMPRIDENIFKNIVVPIPPRNVQDSISKYLIEKEKEVSRLKCESKELKESAINIFLTEIFA